MADKLLYILIGYSICATIVIIILASKTINKYEIDADIKNKKGLMTDNVFKGSVGLKTPKREGLLKRLKNRRLTKKQKL